MGAVLTSTSVVTCKSCSSSVALSDPQHKLTVQGNSVQLQQDVAAGSSGSDWSIASCAGNDPSSGQTRCTGATVSAGAATKLTVGGKGVLLDSLSGNTNGTNEGSLKVGSTQQKLTAT
jgi:hypothetical protein